MAYLPSCCDEELVEEADEPPDISHLFSQSYHLESPFSDCEFSKHTIRNSAPTESLLTLALTMPSENTPTVTRQHRGMSTSSTWSSASAASTVDLVSDGVTSPSRANTPSPPAPNFFPGIQGILQRTKIAFQEPQMKTQFVKQEVAPLEEQQRKPSITFACVGRQAPVATAAVEQPNMQAPENRQVENAAPKKKGLTFACDTIPKREEKVSSPEKVKSNPVMIEGSAAKYTREPRRLYDSEDVEDSWTNQPIDHSRLLRVDDVLKKERDIRKLSEEAEREAKQENGEDEDEDEENNQEDNGVDVDEDNDQDDNDDEDDDDEDADNNDDEEEDDDDDDEYDEDGMSGNESDNEAGFASDDDSDDDLFFGPDPPLSLAKPICCRNTSTTTDSFLKPAARRHTRSPTPELPDSTDFVCGTLDEDRALEEAFVSCITSRKAKAKGKPTPQDIDPSFPTSNSDSDLDLPPPPRKLKPALSRSQSSAERRRYTSPSPPRRSRRPSPAPPGKRSRAASPAPPRRLHSPPPNRSNKSSRHPSPAPRGRAPQFSSRNIARTRSLPRTSACVRRTAKMARNLAGNGSPVQQPTRPVQIRRGAADIFKGLEKRRERRRGRIGAGGGGRKEECRAGEGVEKMREVGLEGRGRRVEWVISA